MGVSDPLDLDGCELPCGYWELNLGPLQEQPLSHLFSPSIFLLSSPLLSSPLLSSPLLSSPRFSSPLLCSSFPSSLLLSLLPFLLSC
jgi:hypothetical protein